MDYINTNIYRSNGTSKTGSSSGSDTKTGNSSLTTQDFLQLLAAQLANQDPSNPTDSTQFISQMAQFSSLQAMDQLSQTMNQQYGASLVGKKVTVTSVDTRGRKVTSQGIVSSMKHSSTGDTIMVNGKEFKLTDVTQVINTTGTPTYTSFAGSATINFHDMAKDFSDYSIKIQYKTGADADASKTVGVVADTGTKQITVTLDYTKGGTNLPTETDLQNVLQGTWTWQQTTDSKVTSATAPTGFDPKKVTVNEAASDTMKSNTVKEVSSAAISVSYS